MILTIKTDESHYLHNKTEPVTFPLADSMKRLIRDMKETLKSMDTASGLAANQVGAPYSVFVYRIDSKSEPVVMINPTIIKAADYGNPAFEMCLSYPKEIYAVSRAKRITVRFFDENGDLYILKYRGHEAIIIQHETDHLLGLTIKDRGSKLPKDLADQLLGDPDEGTLQTELDLGEENGDEKE